MYFGLKSEVLCEVLKICLINQHFESLDFCLVCEALKHIAFGLIIQHFESFDFDLNGEPFTIFILGLLPALTNCLAHFDLDLGFWLIGRI